MQRLLKRLYRERRRAIIVAIVTFLGGYLAFFKSTTVFLGLPFPIIAGLAFMIGLTAFLMLIVILFPAIRHTVEAAALSIPVLSLMGVFSKATDGGLSTNTGIFGILLVSLIVTVYSGSWMDRFLPCRSKRLVSSATSKLRPEELWPYMTVTPDTFGEYGNEDILSMDWIEPGVSFRVIGRSGELAKVEEIHTIEMCKPHESYRFSFTVPDATETASVSCGSKEFHLKATGHGTRLVTIREFDRVSARAQLYIWIDDGTGRLDDEILEIAEAKYGG